MDNTEKKENFFLKAAKYLIPWKGDRPSEIIRKIVFLAAVITLVVTVTNLIMYQVNDVKDSALNKEIQEAYHGTAASEVVIGSSENSGGDTDADEEPQILEQFNSLLELNDDIVGWITVGGESFIDYPVLQGEDNNYYLTHNYLGEYSYSGSLYMDWRNVVTPTERSANIVIYGHDMANGTYFGKLYYYFNSCYVFSDPNDLSFYEEHPTLEFSTLYEKSTYKIFAGMLVNTLPSAGEVFNYHNVHDFATKAEFDDYCAEILDRSTFISPDVDLKYGDNLITLSTCAFGKAYYGDTDLRWVVFAREVREGEDEYVDVSQAYANPSPKFYDLYYEVNGGEWEGRGWDESIIQGYSSSDT